MATDDSGVGENQPGLPRVGRIGEVDGLHPARVLVDERQVGSTVGLREE